MPAVNTAYKHLDAKLRIAELSVGQWAGLFAGTMLAIVWGIYLSPFGGYLSLITAIYLGGIPAGAAFLASVSEFDFWLLVRSAARQSRTDGRYGPGPGQSARGYVVRPGGARKHVRPAVVHDLDLVTLWDG